MVPHDGEGMVVGDEAPVTSCLYAGNTNFEMSAGTQILVRKQREMPADTQLAFSFLFHLRS